MLFGVREKRATLLTQFYQLAIPEVQTPETAIRDLAFGELDRWLYRRTFSSAYSVQDLERQEATWTNAFGLEAATYELFPYAQIHSLLAKCMNAAADHEAPSREEQHDLNDLIKQYLDPPLIIWDEGKDAVVRHGRSGNKPPLIGLMLSEFVKAISDKSLARCESCSNIFPQTRHGMKFCSDRCLNRSQKRRLRSHRKESNVPVEID